MNKLSTSRTVKTLLISAGQSFNAVALVFLASILSRKLSLSEYGTYRQSFLIFEIATPLLLLGLPQAISYFIAKNPHQARAYTLSNIFMLCASSVVLGLFLLAGGGNFIASVLRNEKLEMNLILITLYGCVYFPSLAIMGCLIGTGKAHLIVSYSVISKMLVVACVLGGVIVICATSKMALCGMVIANFISLCIGLVMAWNATIHTSSRFSVKMMNEQLSFSFPIAISSIVSMAGATLDRLIISTKSSPEMLALYANGAIEIPVIGIVTGSITTVILPEMAALFSTGKMNDALKVWGQSAYKSALFLFPLCGLFMVISSEAIVLMYGEKYRQSVIPFRYYLLLMPVRIVVYGALFQAMGRTKEMIYSSLIGLLASGVIVSIIASYWDPMHSGLGIILGFYIVFLPYIFSRITKITGLNLMSLMPWAKIAKILFISAFASMCAAFTPLSNQALIDLILKSTVFTAIYIAFLFTDEKIRIDFQQLIQPFIKKNYL